MTKRKYSIAFKKEVITFIEEENASIYRAVKHFNERYPGANFDCNIFSKWYKKKDEIMKSRNTRARITGGGRRPFLGLLEDMIYDEIIELRIMGMKVTRTFIADRARMIAEDQNIFLKATGNWISGFMSRHNLSLRRTTNLTILTNEQLVQRAVEYTSYLQRQKDVINHSKTLLMDETAVYFEDARTTTVDIRGRSHVVMKSTGFSSMRITVVASVWADGRKAPPLIIHKAAAGHITRHSGPILTISQEKGWVNQELIIEWIDAMFPLIDTTPGKCIVWDSCRVHIAKRVKAHCRSRNISLIVIPGGMTPYLQAGDIGIYRCFKDNISAMIDEWKKSGHVDYTAKGNPKPPSPELVRSWVRDSWNQVSLECVKKSIMSAGFANDFRDWHISKHDIYGQAFCNAWLNAGEQDIDPEVLESIPQPDDIDEIDDCLDGLELDDEA